MKLAAERRFIYCSYMRPYHFKERANNVRKLRSGFLQIAKKQGTPLYIYDAEEVSKNVKAFKKAFSAFGVKPHIFYAAKSNHYVGIMKTVCAEGEGIDVSSDRELKLALLAGAKKIIYTGPAKTESDFELILKHSEKITVNLESFRELELIGKMASKAKKKLRVGLRVVTASQKGWTKFGLPLSSLRTFYDEAKKYPLLHFCGIHFHISFNRDPKKYVKTMKEVAAYLSSDFSPAERDCFEYLDMGGGFVPESFDGIYPWNPDQTMWGQDSTKVISRILKDGYKPRFNQPETMPVSQFAEAISEVFLGKIKKAAPNIELYCEPGRFICHSAMHFLLRLIDLKSPQIGIADGGCGMQGWEKFQFINYAPVFNLSQFTTEREIPFITYGSLCTPDDIWGYYLYTAGQPKEGDVLLLPYQGAYTYTLAQNFIKEIPPVTDLTQTTH